MSDKQPSTVNCEFDFSMYEETNYQDFIEKQQTRIHELESALSTILNIWEAWYSIDPDLPDLSNYKKLLTEK